MFSYKNANYWMIYETKQDTEIFEGGGQKGGGQIGAKFYPISPCIEIVL